jgi:hypothetical protein
MTGGFNRRYGSPIYSHGGSACSGTNSGRLGLGALIGSIIALVATYLTHRLQVNDQLQKERETIKGVLQAIHDEVETLWESYMEEAGARLETLGDGEALDIYYPITQDYFTAYRMNAIFIGRIPNADIRKQIVLTYSKARALIDGFRLNNDFFYKHEFAYWLAEESSSPIHRTRADGTYRTLINYAVKLKKAHSDIKHHVQTLLRDLRKEGVLSKPN